MAVSNVNFNQFCLREQEFKSNNHEKYANVEERKLCTSSERKIIGFNVVFSFSRSFVAVRKKRHVKTLKNHIEVKWNKTSAENIFICQVVAFVINKKL